MQPTNDNAVKMYYTAEELLNREVKEIPMLWKPFIPQTGLAGLTGSSDTGKSTLLRQLAISICLGKTELLGYPLNVRYGSVVYISTEDGKDAISVSIRKQLMGTEPAKVNRLKFIFNDGDPKKTLPTILRKEKVDLVIIDAWTDLFVGNPNDVVQVRTSLNGLSSIAEKFGCSVIILHHTVKNAEYYKPDKNKLNGSQGIEAKLRALIEIRQTENGGRMLSILKGNYISNKQKSNSLVLRFDEDQLLFHSTGMTIEKNTMLSRDRNRFVDDAELRKRFLELKDGEGISYDRVREQLTIEFGEERIPSLTTLKNIHKSVSQNVA